MLKQKAASVTNAIHGIAIAFSEEFNFRIQVAFGLVAIGLGLYFRVSEVEWLFIIAISGLVLTAEAFNTALEELCDMLRSTHDPHVAKIKDLAAGAVLLSSIAAFIIGVTIFLPHLFSL